MIKVKITFDDGSTRVYEFSTKEKLNEFLELSNKIKQVDYIRNI